MELPATDIDRVVQAALAEDVGPGDVTSLATVPPGLEASGVLVARTPMVVAGVLVADAVFRAVDASLRLQRWVEDGNRVSGGTALMRVAGPARALLTAERTALNLLQRLSGVATLTARYVEAVQGTRAKILDTRKTTPGLRLLEKWAVRCGGGENHRFGLYDLVLIKDNHLAALKGVPPNPVAAAVQRARECYPQLKVEVEADSLEQVAQAVSAGADIILLDNMEPGLLRQAVALVGGRAVTEASGGVNLQTVRAIAETGVDYISVGAITHSAPAMDIALDFE
jgi:nicotinate-nucleotide pyrophosphorylase (carboxylating)